MTSKNHDIVRWREDMVRVQLQGRGIHDRQVLEVMGRVPRHLFVEGVPPDQAYGDHPLPIGYGQTISQPYIVAEMTQALELKPSDRVLEIGTGSGYQAAILAGIAAEVFTVERIEALHERSRRLFETLGCTNIRCRIDDGTLGWPDAAPFDAIIVTAGSPGIPDPLVEQLTTGGRLVIPVGDQFLQDLVRIVKTPTGTRTSSMGGCRFVRLVGRHGWQEYPRDF